MSETERINMNLLDEAAEEAGGYVTNFLNHDTHINIRELAHYCKEKGIEPADLTLRELHRFIVA